MKRILVAEDRPASRELIRTILEGCGYEIVEAADGREALERASHQEFDIVLLDLQMPELDGFGVVSRLRSDERYRTTPIVALTASGMRADRALLAGFTSYLAKPVDARTLRSEVARLVGQ